MVLLGVFSKAELLLNEDILKRQTSHFTGATKEGQFLAIFPGKQHSQAHSGMKHPLGMDQTRLAAGGVLAGLSAAHFPTLKSRSSTGAPTAAKDNPSVRPISL